MASAIDDTLPIQGSPTTASVRAQFTTAKNEITALQANTVTAGSGLTGGGAINTDPSLAVGAGTGITVNANDVAFNVTWGDARYALTQTQTDLDTLEATTITAGTGLSGGGTLTSGPTLTLDLDELTTSTTNGHGDYFAVVDSAGNQYKLTKGNINLSEFNNDAGFTTTSGDITGVTAGNGLTGGGSSGSVSLAVGAGTLIDVDGTSVNVDLSELSTSTTDGHGDYFVVTDSANAQRKLTKGSINLSGFNNDSGWTSNTGDITNVTAGTGCTGGGASGSVTINVAGGDGITANANDMEVDDTVVRTAESGGMNIVVDSGSPSGTDANTIYFVT